MKNSFLIFILIFCLHYDPEAQTDSVITGKIYRTWIKPVHWGPVRTGALFEVKDSSVILSNSFKKAKYQQGLYDVSKVDASSIDVIQLRKNHKVRNGIIIAGAPILLIGLTSSIIAISNNNNDDKVLVAFGSTVFTLFFTAVGVGIGALFGSIKTKYQIHGSKQQFDLYKVKLNERSIKPNPEISFVKLSYTAVDVDGNLYHTMALGGQVWMAENLNTAHYRDGSKIPGLIRDYSGGEYKYNWYTVSNNRNICPAGWHVPSFAEWTSLFHSLGGTDYAGRRMGESFGDLENISQWWSSNEEDSLRARSFYLNNESNSVMFSSAAKSNGLNVRCIRDY
jgi:hypothetical protein